MLFIDCLHYYQKYRFFDRPHKYQYRLDNLFYFRDFDLLNIKHHHVVDYANLRLLKVKPATVNREIAFARAAINFYNKCNHTNYPNSFAHFKLLEPEPKTRFLTHKEANRLLKSSLDYGNYNLFAYLLLLMKTGCRSSEILTLTWSRVFLEQYYFTVPNTLTKAKKTIHKPFCTQTKQVLESLKMHHHWVFYNPKTNNRVQTYRKSFERARDRAGLTGLRIHDLRHTYASWLVQKDVSLYKVQRLLGHADISSTMRYAHFANSDLQQAIKKLPNLQIDL